MNETVEDIYTSYAQNIHNSLEDGWDRVVLEIEYSAEDAIAFKGHFENRGSKLSLSFRKFDRRKLVSDTRALHKITTYNDSNNWNRAIFIIDKSSNFKIEFIWDQALADEVDQLANSKN
uniref:hypothetical protein n=1 Tax=Rheinheimera sp. TaxID=1869214 RepID=UPI0040484E48